MEAAAVVVAVVAETGLDSNPMISFSDVWAYAEEAAQTAVAVVVLAVAVVVDVASASAVLHYSRPSCHHPADQKKTSLRRFFVWVRLLLLAALWRFLLETVA